ncbi:MAG: hypothetical protein H0T89_06050 [Deltaproteobacteria bacterium]|nr:hypothetical protein [Deltaproteobacteria bacterium]MDQ3296933.1 hypothetical protein [Myxococcota bacterium]
MSDGGDPGEPKDPPPKRRRKPPPSLEGIDTGIPDNDYGVIDPSAPTQAAEITSTKTQATGPLTVAATAGTGTLEPMAPPPLTQLPDPATAEIPPTAIDPEPDLSRTFEPAMQGTLASGPTRMPEEPAIPAAPTTYGDDALREAVGAKPAKRTRKPPDEPLPSRFDDDADSTDDDDGLPGRPRNRKLIVIAVGSLVVGLGIAAMIFLGYQNSGWFYLRCEADRVVAEEGRTFPPWGSQALEDKEWKPIKIPPEAECAPLETESYPELVAQFRAILVKRATVLLTAKEVTKADEAAALLEQALLHARSHSDAARNARIEIQRLLGDVVYWRASLKMRDAAKALDEAARQFDAASLQRPRHVTDAAAWADHVRKIVGELEAGPTGSSQTVFPPVPPASDRPPAPPGVALPVEPGPATVEQPAAPPDAGVPTGGVLL